MFQRFANATIKGSVGVMNKICTLHSSRISDAIGWKFFLSGPSNFCLLRFVDMPHYGRRTMCCCVGIIIVTTAGINAFVERPFLSHGSEEPESFTLKKLI
jgi:hypothetical protein